MKITIKEALEKQDSCIENSKEYREAVKKSNEELKKYEISKDKMIRNLK